MSAEVKPFRGEKCHNEESHQAESEKIAVQHVRDLQRETPISGKPTLRKTNITSTDKICYDILSENYITKKTNTKDTY